MSDKTYVVPTRSQRALHVCDAWLRAEGQSVKAGASVYGLKHVVARWLRRTADRHVFITTGAMATALMTTGFALEERGPRVLVCNGPPGRKGNAVRGGTARRRTTGERTHKPKQQRTTT